MSRPAAQNALQLLYSSGVEVGKCEGLQHYKTPPASIVPFIPGLNMHLGLSDCNCIEQKHGKSRHKWCLDYSDPLWKLSETHLATSEAKCKWSVSLIHVIQLCKTGINVCVQIQQ